MDTIYTILSKENIQNSWKFKVHINAEHIVFKGHFPELPVVPGAVLVQMLKELLENALEKKLSLKEAKSIKFIQVLYPEDAKELEVFITLTEGEMLKVVAEFKVGENVYCKISGLY